MKQWTILSIVMILLFSSFRSEAQNYVPSDFSNYSSYPDSYFSPSAQQLIQEGNYISSSVRTYATKLKDEATSSEALARYASYLDPRGYVKNSKTSMIYDLVTTGKTSRSKTASDLQEINEKDVKQQVWDEGADKAKDKVGESAEEIWKKTREIRAEAKEAKAAAQTTETVAKDAQTLTRTTAAGTEATTIATEASDGVRTASRFSQAVTKGEELFETGKNVVAPLIERAAPIIQRVEALAETPAGKMVMKAVPLLEKLSPVGEAIMVTQVEMKVLSAGQQDEIRNMNRLNGLAGAQINGNDSGASQLGQAMARTWGMNGQKYEAPTFTNVGTQMYKDGTTGELSNGAGMAVMKMEGTIQNPFSEELNTGLPMGLSKRNASGHEEYANFGTKDRTISIDDNDNQIDRYANGTTIVTSQLGGRTHSVLFGDQATYQVNQTTPDGKSVSSFYSANFGQVKGCGDNGDNTFTCKSVTSGKSIVLSKQNLYGANEPPPKVDDQTVTVSADPVSIPPNLSPEGVSLTATIPEEELPSLPLASKTLNADGSVTVGTANPTTTTAPNSPLAQSGNSSASPEAPQTNSGLVQSTVNVGTPIATNSASNANAISGDPSDASASSGNQTDGASVNASAGNADHTEIADADKVSCSDLTDEKERHTCEKQLHDCESKGGNNSSCGEEVAQFKLGKSIADLTQQMNAARVQKAGDKENAHLREQGQNASHVDVLNSTQNVITTGVQAQNSQTAIDGVITAGMGLTAIKAQKDAQDPALIASLEKPAYTQIPVPSDPTHVVLQGTNPQAQKFLQQATNGQLSVVTTDADRMITKATSLAKEEYARRYGKLVYATAGTAVMANRTVASEKSAAKTQETSKQVAEEAKSTAKPDSSNDGAARDPSSADGSGDPAPATGGGDSGTGGGDPGDGGGGL